MARFVLGRRAEVSPYAACCYAIFLNFLISATRGRFISGDEGHGTRQRPGYQVSPRLSLSCPMHAGNKTDSVQKTSPPLVKQAAYGETRAANIKKKLMKNKLPGEAAAPANAVQQSSTRVERVTTTLFCLELHFSRARKLPIPNVRLPTASRRYSRQSCLRYGEVATGEWCNRVPEVV